MPPAWPRQPGPPATVEQLAAVRLAACRRRVDPDRRPTPYGVPLEVLTAPEAATLLAALAPAAQGAKIRNRQRARAGEAPFDQLRPWPELHAWRLALERCRPGDLVPPCPTPASDPDGRPYGTAYLERQAIEPQPPQSPPAREEGPREDRPDNPASRRGAGPPAAAGGPVATSDACPPPLVAGRRGAVVHHHQAAPLGPAAG